MERGRNDWIAVLLFFIFWPVSFLKILNYVVLGVYALIVAFLLVMMVAWIGTVITEAPVAVPVADERPPAPIEWGGFFTLVLRPD